MKKRGEEILSWRSLKSAAVMPCAREGHSLTYVPHKRILLLFGGLGADKRNELMSYCLEEQLWSVAKTVGAKPANRSYHTAEFQSQSRSVIYSFGKVGDSSVNDVYLLQVSGMAWYKLYLPLQPSPRHHHCSSFVRRNQLFLFGGASYPMNVLSDELWVLYTRLTELEDSQPSARTSNKKGSLSVNTFSLKQPTIREEDAEFEIRGCEFRYIRCAGDCPPPIFGHRACVMRGQFCVIGQADDQSRIRLWLLSDSYEWSLVSTTGAVPSSRRFFSLFIDSEKLLLFGGVARGDKFSNSVDMMFLEHHYWVRPFVQGEKPSPRSHQGQCSGEGKLFVLGGIGRTYCAMGLLQLSPSRIGGRWVPLCKPTAKERKAAQMLRTLVMDTAHYIHELQNQLSKEYSAELSISRQLQPLKQQSDRIPRYHKEFIQGLEDKISRLGAETDGIDKTHAKLLAYAESERALSELIRQRSSRLERGLMNYRDWKYFRSSFNDINHGELKVEYLKLGEQMLELADCLADTLQRIQSANEES